MFAEFIIMDRVIWLLFNTQQFVCYIVLNQQGSIMSTIQGRVSNVSIYYHYTTAR